MTAGRCGGGGEVPGAGFSLRRGKSKILKRSCQDLTARRPHPRFFSAHGGAMHAMSRADQLRRVGTPHKETSSSSKWQNRREAVTQSRGPRDTPEVARLPKG